MKYETILFDIKDNVAKIVLNRPNANNSIDLQMSKDLMYVAMHCAENPDVRAVIITGTGNTFCPGGDVKSFASAGKDLPYLIRDMTIHANAAVSRLTRLDAPLIVAVNGAAAGAGMALACSGDIVLAAESARFTTAYTKIGLSPDGGLSYYLPRIVGLKRALELTLTNRLLTAKEALELGIVTRIVPDKELMKQAEAVAAQLASGATKALGTTKRLLHRGWVETLETQLENESQAFSEMAHTLDAQEAIKAFVEKRAPKLQGK